MQIAAKDATRAQVWNAAGRGLALSAIGSAWAEIRTSTRVVIALAAVLGVPGASWAWPVDWIHDVEPGKEKFLSLPRVDWFEVEDPRVVSVEWFEATNELLLAGLKPGRSLVLVGAGGKVALWRVRVGTSPVLDEGKAAAAREACPQLRGAPEDGVQLAVAVKTEKCRLALFELFQTDAHEARSVELEFDAAVLQNQLRLLLSAFAKVPGANVTARYLGAGLVLEGKATTQAFRQLLWAYARTALGRFVVDAQVDLEAGDAGRPAKAGEGAARATQ
jgi:hypothetical protein